MYWERHNLFNVLLLKLNAFERLHAHVSVSQSLLQTIFLTNFNDFCLQRLSLAKTQLNPWSKASLNSCVEYPHNTRNISTV